MDARNDDFSSECPDKLEPAVVWKYCDTGHPHICYHEEECPLCTAMDEINDILSK